MDKIIRNYNHQLSERLIKKANTDSVSYRNWLEELIAPKKEIQNDVKSN